MEITYVALQCRLTWIFTVSTSSKSAMGSLSPFSSSTLLTGLNRQTTFMLDDMSAGAAPSQIRDNAAKQRLDHRSPETTLGNTDGVLFAAATRLLKGVVSGLWTCPSVWWSAVFCVAPLVARTRISLQRRLVRGAPSEPPLAPCGGCSDVYGAQDSVILLLLLLLQLGGEPVVLRVGPG